MEAVSSAIHLMVNMAALPPGVRHPPAIVSFVIALVIAVVFLAICYLKIAAVYTERITLP